MDFFLDCPALNSHPDLKGLVSGKQVRPDSILWKINGGPDPWCNSGTMVANRVVGLPHAVLINFLQIQWSKHWERETKKITNNTGSQCIPVSQSVSQSISQSGLYASRALKFVQTLRAQMLLPKLIVMCSFLPVTPSFVTTIQFHVAVPTVLWPPNPASPQRLPTQNSLNPVMNGKFGNGPLTLPTKTCKFFYHSLIL